MPAALSIVRAPTDLDLASRCVGGDTAAQRELFHRERLRVHATLFRLLGSNHQIDDLIQEAFLEVFRSLKDFRGESSLRTWIDRCTVRVAYAFFRRRRPRAAQLELVQDIATSEPSAEDRTVLREAAARLYAELDTMNPKQRMAFTLHVIEGRPLQDVAKVMGATLVATKTRVWRARRAIEKRASADPVLADFLTGTVPTPEEIEPCDPS